MDKCMLADSLNDADENGGGGGGVMVAAAVAAADDTDADDDCGGSGVTPTTIAYISIVVRYSRISLASSSFVGCSLFADDGCPSAEHDDGFLHR